MGMVLCQRCKQIFDERDLQKDYTDAGYRGEPHESCPYCGEDDITDVEQCTVCGKWIIKDDEPTFGSYGNIVCMDCLEEKAQDVRTVVEYANEHTDDVEINGLFAYVYSAQEINDILMADFTKLPEQMQKDYCKGFAEGDWNEFADYE